MCCLPNKKFCIFTKSEYFYGLGTGLIIEDFQEKSSNHTKTELQDAGKSKYDNEASWHVTVLGFESCFV